MDKDFKLKLDDPKFLEEFVNQVVVAKVIADSIGENPAYENVVRISDELNISIEETYGYLRLYKYMQKQMIL